MNTYRDVSRNPSFGDSIILSGAFWGLVHLLAEACGNRTHPGRLSATRNGFEARENHQAPCASGRCESSKVVNYGARRSHFPFVICHLSFVIICHLSLARTEGQRRAIRATMTNDK